MKELQELLLETNKILKHTGSEITVPLRDE